MQAAGLRTRCQQRLSAAAVQEGITDKAHRSRDEQAQQPLSKKQKRSRSDVDSAPVAKKRRSAPELPKAGTGLGHATPIVQRRYFLRQRSSVPGPGTRFTDGSLPSSMPCSVRPRNSDQRATWSELPGEVLKMICQHLDPTTIFLARGVSISMRDACSGMLVPLSFMLPMQSNPWAPIQLEAWERRVNGVVGALSNGHLRSAELQLRMEGAEAWKQEEYIPSAQIRNAAAHLDPLIGSLRKLGNLKDMPITHLDVDLPMTQDTVASLSTSLPNVTSLRFDSLIPPPYNHVLALTERKAFSHLRKLDVCVTAWDQLQHLAALTQLTDLNIRYSIWNIPELTPLVALQQLETFGFEVVDDRARFQLDFLGALVQGVDSLRHLRASIILSRTAVSDLASAKCEFLNHSLESVTLDVRVPQDAARVAHLHFRNMYTAPPDCKMRLTIRADALMRETSFESAATRAGYIAAPRLGMAQPSPPEARERWECLQMIEGLHPPDALQLHLRGYHLPLTGLPDLSGAHLKQLQISNARLNAADFVALAGCTTLEQLYVRFAFLPDPPPSWSGSGVAAGASAPVALHNCASGSDSPGSAAFFRSYLCVNPREMQASLNARLAASNCIGMLTRSRKSQIAGRQSIGTGGTPPPPPRDCKDKPAPYVLMPLLKLAMLEHLELLEVRDGDQALNEPSEAGQAGGLGAGLGSVAESFRHGRFPGGAAPDDNQESSVVARGQPPAPVTSAAGGQPPPASRHSPLKLSRSGLGHFLRGLASLGLQVVSLQLLAEEESLSDCPCRRPCFVPGGTGKEAPPRLDADGIVQIFHSVPLYKVVLGSQVVAKPNWYRPSAWPKVQD